jgi:transcriptional regulator with XRE-family HTH domain
MDFGTLMRDLMRERELSGRGLARKVHCDPALISRLVCGRQRPSAEMARELDKLLAAGGALAAAAKDCGPDEANHLVSQEVVAALAVAYGGSQAPYQGGSWIQQEVLMAAHESGEHAERAEHREIGEATLEQLRADVIRLSRDFMFGPPLSAFLQMRRVRDRMHAALDRRMWPRDQAELYFLLGCLNGLMAIGAWDLGSPAGAEELARAGWAYAIAIDNRPLLGHLREELAIFADWTDRPREARDLAENGLRYMPDGPTAALLHLRSGRMAARLGEADAARNAVAAAHAAHEGDYRDDLVEIGGEFGLSRATRHYKAGSVLIEIPGAESEAAAELDYAVELYAAGPGPDEQHGYTMEALARIHLATARLRAGSLDAAVAAADPVLSLPPAKRVATLTQSLGRVRRELAQPVYSGSALVREFDDRVEDFCSDTVVTEMRGLPGGPA